MWSWSNSSKSLVWWTTSERFAEHITSKRKIFHLVCVRSFNPSRSILFTFRVFLPVAHCTYSELDGIKAVLKQSKEIGSIKQILLRKELQQKVKQYDGKLSNVVQRFQVCHRFSLIPITLPTLHLQVTLALDTRFAQLADQKGNKVHILPVSGHCNQLTSTIGCPWWSIWSLEPI